MTNAQINPEPDQQQELTIADLGDKTDILSQKVTTFDKRFNNY